MKTLEQNSAGMNAKSVTKVSQRNFGKTDARYWQDKIYKRKHQQEGGGELEADQWSVKLQHLRQAGGISTLHRKQRSSSSEGKGDLRNACGRGMGCHTRQV